MSAPPKKKNKLKNSLRRSLASVWRAARVAQSPPPVQAAAQPQPGTAVMGNVDLFDLQPDGRLRVAGWALASSPVRELAVRLNDRTLATLPCTLPRPDVAAAHASVVADALHSGFQGELTLGALEREVNRLELEACCADGTRARLWRQRVFAPGYQHPWATSLNERGVSEDDCFYFPIATSHVAGGGAMGIKETFAPYESRTVRVGIRVQILYLRTTRGAAHDWVFDPDFVADKRVHGRLIAEDSLNDVMGFAVQHQLPVLFTLNGGIWADSACSAPEWDVNDALEGDPSLCQWNEKNEVMPDTALADLPGSTDSPELGRSLSLNVFLDKVRHYKKRNLQQAAALIQRFAQAHPQLFIGVNLDADVYVNPFFEGAQWYDYNPETLRQFRHWLRGDGPYAGEGGARLPDLSRYRLARVYTLADIDALTGRRHATWDEVDAPREFPALLRPFWKNPWVQVWERFRRHLVQLHYDELSQWVAETGIAPERIYSSQGFMPPGELIDPLPVRIDSPAKNYDTGGMSIEGSAPTHGRLGAILYGDSAVNQIKMEGSASLFAEFRRYSPDWAVVEHNTGELTQASRLGTYAQAYRSLHAVANHGGCFISSMAWNGSPGDTVGMAGFRGYTTLRRSPLEEAMQDFMLARADLPRRARLWTFGAASHADGDGWWLDGQPAEPAQPGQLLMHLGSQGQAELLSPAELDWRGGGQPASLVVRLPAAERAGVRLSVEGQAADGTWLGLCADAALDAAPADAAGVWLALSTPDAGPSTPIERLRLSWRGRAGARLHLQSIALYPLRGAP